MNLYYTFFNAKNTSKCDLCDLTDQRRTRGRGGARENVVSCRKAPQRKIINWKRRRNSVSSSSIVCSMHIDVHRGRAGATVLRPPPFPYGTFCQVFHNKSIFFSKFAPPQPLPLPPNLSFSARPCLSSKLGSNQTWELQTKKKQVIPILNQSALLLILYTRGVDQKIAFYSWKYTFPPPSVTCDSLQNINMV